MESRIKAYVDSRNHFKVFHLFGYSSKGIPGIEIIGLGAHGRSIKEKFIFLVKSRGLKLPLRRFVLCVEGDMKSIRDEEFRWLELPLFILLIELSGLIHFRELDQCISSGKIGVDGQVDLKKSSLDQIPSGLEGLKFIHDQPFEADHECEPFTFRVGEVLEPLNFKCVLN
jgi:hypothetical protein